jgi:hypothetical protein
LAGISIVESNKNTEGEMKKMSEMPDHARVWIYQASRFLSEQEMDLVQQESSAFVTQWSSHGAQLDATIELIHSRILVIAADEQQAQASGCGIDKSVHFVKELGSKIGVDFFNRTIVLYLKDGMLCDVPLHEFWALRKALIISDDTVVIDTTIRTVGALRSGFQKPFSSSWHAEMWGR